MQNKATRNEKETPIKKHLSKVRTLQTGLKPVRTKRLTSVKIDHEDDTKHTPKSFPGSDKADAIESFNLQLGAKDKFRDK